MKGVTASTYRRVLTELSKAGKTEAFRDALPKIRDMKMRSEEGQEDESLEGYPW